LPDADKREGKKRGGESRYREKRDKKIVTKGFVSHALTCIGQPLAHLAVGAGVILADWGE